MQLEGLHHVTAITGDASLNVAFYTQVLGLHLVKKTVSQPIISSTAMILATPALH